MGWGPLLGQRAGVFLGCRGPAVHPRARLLPGGHRLPEIPKGTSFMIPEVCWLGLHHGFFQWFWDLSRGIWAHFLPGVWRGIWELSANALLTAGRVFSSGYLGGAWVCPSPWPLEPAWGPSRETMQGLLALCCTTRLSALTQGWRAGRGVSAIGTSWALGRPPGVLRLT